jgi:protein-S-isoprenylcysteine O-methyltransferase Ste14
MDRLVAIIIAVGWIVLWSYWIVSAVGAKKNTKPRKITQFVGVRLSLIVLAAALVLLSKRLPFSIESQSPGVENVSVRILGLVLFLIGIVFALWARKYLGKNWGMPMTQKQSPELVTSGPYRYIRHPIYSGMLLMALGSLLDVNLYWLVVFVVFAVYFVYSSVFEEALMMKQFPKEYPSYKRKTKMFIPFVL